MIAQPRKGTRFIEDQIDIDKLEAARDGRFNSVAPERFHDLLTTKSKCVTLDHYPLECLSDPKQFQLFKLDSAEIYYGLRSCGEGRELVNLMNLDRNSPGWATAVVMLHAIEHGVTYLNAFDVNLPKRYASFGFIETSSTPFDPYFKVDDRYVWVEPGDHAHLRMNSRLKEVIRQWKVQGWKPKGRGLKISNFPHIVEMKLGITEHDRAMARSVFWDAIFGRPCESGKLTGVLKLLNGSQKSRLFQGMVLGINSRNEQGQANRRVKEEQARKSFKGLMKRSLTK